MAEYPINPKHNVFKKYRKVNYINPYVFNYGSDFITDLVAYYSFDGSNATDIHTGTHNGTLVGSPTFPAGKNSNCIEFGSGKGVNVADSTDFSFTNGSNDVPFSVSMWVNFNSVSGVNFLASKWGIGTFGEWIVAYNSTFFTFLLYNYSAFSLIRANYTFTPTTSTWYHLVCTYDGSELNSGLKIYLNGALMSSTNSGTYTGMINGVSQFQIGNNDSNEYFKGKSDELAIWKDRELTALEVAELYNGGAGKFYNTF